MFAMALSHVDAARACGQEHLHVVDNAWNPFADQNNSQFGTDPEQQISSTEALPQPTPGAEAPREPLSRDCS